MAYQPPAHFALDGGDARIGESGKVIAEYGRPQLRKAYDPSVTYEEYLYYAELTRQEEKSIPHVKHPIRKLAGLGKNRSERKASLGLPPTEPAAMTEKSDGITRELSANHSVVTDAEWTQAARAARTATWGAVFYLITTDVLGPYSTPWAFAQMGFGPGVALYTVFGALAGYTGWQLWQIFLSLDSNVHPMKTYGDFAFRLFGPTARHLINILQSVQLLFNVGIIIIGNGQGIYQINPKICYIACCIIWAVAGMILGQIRTLQRFGWIAHFAIWINISVLIMTMAVVTHTGPNYTASSSLNENLTEDQATLCNSSPSADPVCAVHTYAGTPEYAVGFSTALNGLNQAVYSYGGAMLYCEFMSEMRRPWDFWKALICAETFIYFVYMFFGIYVYAYQGQFSINPANQGMGPKAAYTAGNIIYFVATLIAAALYGNIGIKVLYQNVLKELLGFPDLTAKSGKLIWAALVPVYWGIAFVLAAAIPNFNYLSGLVGAVCILQFTYTFPPLFMLAHMIKKNAIQPGEGFDPATGRTVRLDRGVRRWVRGAKKHWYLNLWNLVFCLGALTTAALGCYSAIEGLITAFAAGHQTSFSCSH